MPERAYDVVIIGSGISGVCAAARLVHAGYSVLVLERFRQLGGRFSTVDHKGFKLSTGANDVECNCTLEETFHLVEAEFDVRHPEPDVAYRIDGVDHVLPRQGGLRKLISLGARDQEEEERVRLAFRRALTWEEPSFTLSLRDWLAQYTDTEKLQGIFQGFAALVLAINSYEAKARTFIRFLKAMGGRVVHGYAVHGNVTLVNALAEAIQRLGGQVLNEAEVDRILVSDDGVVEGVRYQRHGRESEVRAKVVLSSVGPRGTIRLAGEANFDKGYLKEVELKQRPAPVISIYAAADRPLMTHPGVLVLTDNTRRVCSIRSQTLTCPELAPPGKHLIESFSALGDSYGPVDFDQEAALSIMDLKDHIPGFDRHAEILMVTYHRGEWPAFHSWPGWTIAPRTPIENLWNIGDGISPEGWPGLESSAEGSKRVVEDVMARIRPST
ncbi:MAG: NAD(P)/FAD-dependent oxidoreductase [Dehalococcoidia bacterium]|nr:NAD(P)/FAD-dependent oxidoreductase [Dehalococcoidia bacterium]